MMSEGTSMLTEQMKDKNRIGVEYSPYPSDAATYIFFLRNNLVFWNQMVRAFSNDITSDDIMIWGHKKYGYWYEFPAPYLNVCDNLNDITSNVGIYLQSTITHAGAQAVRTTGTQTVATFDFSIGYHMHAAPADPKNISIWAYIPAPMPQPGVLWQISTTLGGVIVDSQTPVIPLPIADTWYNITLTTTGLDYDGIRLTLSGLVAFDCIIDDVSIDGNPDNLNWGTRADVFTQTIRTAQNHDDTFIEPIQSLRWIDTTLTTATVDTANSTITGSPSSTVSYYSQVIYKHPYRKADSVTLTATEEIPAGTSITWSVSSDEGSNFQAVTNGSATSITPGESLILKAELSSTGSSVPSITAGTLNPLELSYTTTSPTAQFDVSLFDNADFT